MKMIKKYSCIILAAGSGLRINQSVPKQYLTLGGKPIIIHAVEKFEKIKEVAEIIVVVNHNYVNYVEKLISDYNIEKTITVVVGGETRQKSVYIGLKTARYENILLHEAARPFIKIREIEQIINHPEQNVSYANEISYTVVLGNEKIESLLDRRVIKNVQLPQKFNRELLLRAHEKAIRDLKNYTDDTTLLFDSLNISSFLIKGHENNIKITYDIDLIIAEEIYKNYILED